MFSDFDFEDVVIGLAALGLLALIAIPITAQWRAAFVLLDLLDRGLR